MCNANRNRGYVACSPWRTSHPVPAFTQMRKAISNLLCRPSGKFTCLLILYPLGGIVKNELHNQSAVISNLTGRTADVSCSMWYKLEQRSAKRGLTCLCLHPSTDCVYAQDSHGCDSNHNIKSVIPRKCWSSRMDNILCHIHHLQRLFLNYIKLTISCPSLAFMHLLVEFPSQSGSTYQSTYAG